MQKKHLLAGSAIGGFLLATTALTSTASAQALLAIAGAGAGTNVDGIGGSFATERFATGGATLTVGAFDVVYNLGGTFQNGTIRLQIDTNIGSFLAGINAGAAGSAAYVTAAVTAGSNALVASALGGSVESVTVSSISAFGGQISVTYSLPATAVQSVVVESLKLAQVQGLSAAGTALTLTTQLFTGDSTTSSASDTLTIGTSAATHSLSAATPATLTANATATVPFSQFVGGTVTGTLATLNVIGSSAQPADLGNTADDITTLVNATNGLNVSATSALLTQTGVTRAQVVAAFSTTTTTTATVSTGAISSAGTFTVLSVEPAAGFVVGTTSVAVQAVFDGATAIENADAGTVSATLAGTTTSVLATASGTTAAVVRNGIVTEVNYFQGSGDSFSSATGTFQSFLRISNSGTVAGAATITAVDSTGTTVGSFSTPSIPVNGQLQISNVALEQGDSANGITGLGITDGVNGQYTVLITGPFQGYVQHVMVNNVTNTLTNLSGFRGNTGSGNQIP